MIGAVVVEALALALGAELLLDRALRGAGDGHKVDRAAGEDAEVDAAAPVAGASFLVHLTRGLVLELLLLSLCKEGLKHASEAALRVTAV